MAASCPPPISSFLMGKSVRLSECSPGEVRRLVAEDLDAHGIVAEAVLAEELDGADHRLAETEGERKEIHKGTGGTPSGSPSRLVEAS